MQHVQQTYPCPNCGYPVVFGIRFCGNCGTALNWSTQVNQGQLRLPQAPPKKREDVLGFVGVLAIVALIGVLIAGGIILYDSSQTPVVSAAPTAQPLPLSAPIPSSPGLYADTGQTVDTLTPTFQWNTVSGADSYSLIVSKFPYGAGNIVYSPAQIAGTSLMLPDNVLAYGERYRWTVEARGITSTSNVSDALYFKTPEPPAPTPTDSACISVPPISYPAVTPVSPSPSIGPWTPVTLPGWTPI
jgi:hypothetical protein